LINGKSYKFTDNTLANEDGDDEGEVASYPVEVALFHERERERERFHSVRGEMKLIHI
jgi:hypothetical protein